MEHTRNAEVARENEFQASREKELEATASRDDDKYSYELELSDAERKRLLRRIDYTLVPYAALLYLLSFLDRTNIGQARLAGLEKDLHLHGNQYNIALTVFFVSYSVFDVPSNILLKYFTPRRWIGFIMTVWSICTICMGLTKNAQGLYATRFLLGVFESGLFPGLNLLLVSWYTRAEQSFRISIFFAGATLAGAFGGLLAFAIRHMDGIGGKGGWAWIFILEGAISLLCAIPAFWLVPGFPHESRLLNDTERKHWLRYLEKSQGVTSADLPLSSRQITRPLFTWTTWAYGLIYLGTGQAFNSLAFFVPTIIAALGFKNATANLLSAAPYGLATITTLVTAYIADKYKIKAYIIVPAAIINIIGYIILLCDVSAGVKYLAVFIAVAGANATAAPLITWAGSNSGPTYSRATVLGIFFTTGSMSGVIAANTYPSVDGPRYVKGHIVSICFMMMAVVISTILALHLRRENARHDAKYGVPAADGHECSVEYCQDKLVVAKYGLEGKTRDEIVAMGDKHPAFRYIW